MKKLITILTIMIVLVGAVFAASTDSSLIVTTKINSLEPTFKLSTAETGTATSEVALGTAGTLSNAYAITTDYLLANDATVTFYVRQISMSRSVKTYTLTATATDLVLYQYPNQAGNGNILVSTTAHPADPEYKRFEVTGRDTSTGIAVVKTFADGALETAKATYGGAADGSSKTITYKGNAVGSASSTDIVVASFTCTWNDNINAVSGDYQATVTLTVEAT